MTCIKRSASSLVDKVKPSTISISPRVFVEGSRMPAAVLGEAMGTWSCVLIISLISEPEKYTVITWQFFVTFLGWWWLSVTLFNVSISDQPNVFSGWKKGYGWVITWYIDVICTELGGGNSNIFYVHPYLGEIITFDEHIFQRGWNHQLENVLSLANVGDKHDFHTSWNRIWCGFHKSVSSFDRFFLMWAMKTPWLFRVFCGIPFVIGFIISHCRNPY